MGRQRVRARKGSTSDADTRGAGDASGGGRRRPHRQICRVGLADLAAADAADDLRAAGGTCWPAARDVEPVGAGGVRRVVRADGVAQRAQGNRPGALTRADWPCALAADSRAVGAELCADRNQRRDLGRPLYLYWGGGGGKIATLWHS